MRIILSIIFVLTLIFSAYGQHTVGRIDITVIENSGTPVPNASIRLESTEIDGNKTSARFQRILVTNESGFQHILLVPPGVYRVNIIANDFYEKKVENIRIDAGQTTSLKIDLGAPRNINIETDEAVLQGRVPIYIYADRNLLLHRAKASIFIDGEEIAQLGPSRYIPAIVAPGRHIISFNKSKKRGSIENEFLRGQIYFLRLNWKNGKQLRPRNLEIVSKGVSNISRLVND